MRLYFVCVVCCDRSQRKGGEGERRGDRGIVGKIRERDWVCVLVCMYACVWGCMCVCLCVCGWGCLVDV